MVFVTKYRRKAFTDEMPGSLGEVELGD
ncbi:hypothetical protein LMU33_24530 [Streptomyces sp. JA03]|nr:hypothetical protein [Streptomyces barringtoniae]